MILRPLQAFLVSGVVGAMIGAGSLAYATPDAYTRHSPFECFVLEGPVSETGSGISEELNNGAVIDCPISDSAAIVSTTSSVSLDKTNITSADVIIHVGTGATHDASVNACVGYSTSVGGTCTNTSYATTTVGTQTINPDVSVWPSHPGGFAYVQVYLPAESGSAFVYTYLGLKTHTN